MNTQLSSGAVVPARRLRAINGRPVLVPARGGRTHLQFRGFAGCPICHLELFNFAVRYEEVADAGITEVVVLFQSPDDELCGYHSLLPFAVVADLDRVLHRDFGVATGLRAIAGPRTWWAAIRGWPAVLLHRTDPDCVGGCINRRTHLGLPSDFLIDPDGTVVAAHYGRHAGDQWSVDRLLDVQRLLRGTGAS